MKHLVNFVRNFNEIEDELEIADVFKKIKEGEFELEIQRYRHALISNSINASDLKKKLLAFTPSGIFDETRKKGCLKQYSGILHLDLDKLDESQMMSLTSKLRNDDLVFAFFVSPSGNGLKVFFKTDDTSNKHQINTHALMEYFEKKYEIKPDFQVKDISRLCFISSDPGLFLNENSLTFKIKSDNKVFQKIMTLELQVQKNFKIEFSVGQRNDYILKLASICRDNKVPQDLIEEYCFEKYECPGFEHNEITKTISNAYINRYYENKRNNRAQSKRELMEGALLNEGYQFRFNLVKKRTEISLDGLVWQEVDDRVENDIVRDMESNGYNFGSKSLRTSLNSSFAIDYNPFIEYLSELPPWDGEDYIRDLYNTLNAPEELSYYLEKWLVALVASILDPNIQNQTVLLLIGSQGIGKSRWLNKLIPIKLKEYSVQGIFDPKEKDTKILMSENLIGNLDELDSIDKRDVPRFKEIITSPGTKVRVPYARNATVLPRRISFCGSVNSLDFLQDFTGSRRFLCIEIDNQINDMHTVNIDLVYSQALVLYKNGCKPYFTKAESEIIQERNKKFKAYSVEEELIAEYFEPTDDIPKNKRMSTIEIIQQLEQLLGENNKIRLNPTTIGKVLTGLGYKKTKTNGIYKYSIQYKKGGRDL